MLKTIKIPECAEQVFLLSDLHYGHTKLVEPRGFKTAQEHDDTLVARWNERVSAADTVIHLGDLIVGAGETKTPEYDFWLLLNRLRFKHLYLLWGNHAAQQHQVYTAAVRRQFPSLAAPKGGITAEVYPLHTETGDRRPVTFLPAYAEVSIGGQHAVLSHYPLASWNLMAASAPMIHGHCHCSLHQPMNRRRDVGFECYGGPVSFARLLKDMEDEQPAKVDHH